MPRGRKSTETREKAVSDWRDAVRHVRGISAALTRHFSITPVEIVLLFV